MKKRLVRKAFDMIRGISMSEDREVYIYLPDILCVLIVLHSVNI